MHRNRMSSESARRLIALARVNSSPAQLWRQALPHNERTASTFSAPEAGGNGKQDNPHESANPHRSHENSNFRSSKSASLRSPDTSTLRKPGTRSHVGISGPGYGRNEAGATNRGTSLDSAYLGQADDVPAMRNAYNNAQENHFKYGTNAGVANSESMAPSLERDMTRPDAASANASATNQVPSTSPFASINQRPQANILEQHNSTSRAQEYHVCKARIHATLWQQELRKQAGDLEENADSSIDPLMSNSNTRNRMDTFGLGAAKTVPQDWESFDPPEGEIYDDNVAKEEALMFEEFEKRRERNRIQIASFVKQHLYGRRRPVDGWKYIINNFGADNKAAKGSALGSALGGRQTTGNDLEKLALKRESGRLRKKA